jgi:hypothetical protein
MADLFPMTDLNVLAQGDRPNRLWPPRKSPGVILRVRFERLIEHHAPVGYEDETGFRYGIQPAPSDSNPPMRVQN